MALQIRNKIDHFSLCLSFERQLSDKNKKSKTILTVIMGSSTKIVWEILAMVFRMAAIVNMADEDVVIFGAFVSVAVLRVFINCGSSMGVKI